MVPLSILVIVVSIPAGLVYSEFGIEGLIAFVFYGFAFVILLGLAGVAGLWYIFFWALEVTGAIEDNPLDEFFTVTIWHWGESLALVEWIRVPLIYFEYLITLFLGQEDFNVNSQGFQAVFLMLAWPFVWQFIFFINPLLLVFMPIILIVYHNDKDLLEKDVYIFTTSSSGIKKDKRPNICNKNLCFRNDIKDAQEAEASGEVATKPREKKLIHVAQAGVGTFIAKIYQLQWLLFDNFEFLTNNDFLELRERRIWTVAFLPYLFPMYQLIYYPVVVIWGLCSMLIVFFYFLIVSF